MTEEQMVLMEISAQLFAIKFEMFKDAADRNEFNRRIEEYIQNAQINKHESDRKKISDRLWGLRFKEKDL